MNRKIQSSIADWDKLLELNPSYREVNRVKNYRNLYNEVIERILNNNLSAEKLEFIMNNYKDKKLTEKAGRIILEKNPNRDNLFFVMKNISSLREQAFEKFLKRGPLEEELLYIMMKIKPLQKKVWEVLKKIRPTVEIIEKVVEKISEPRIRKEATIMIAEQAVPYNMSKRRLKEKYFVVKSITNKKEVFSEEDFKEFLASDLSNDNDILMKIIRHYNNFDQRIWEKLQELYIRNKDLLHIIRLAPSIESQAIKVLKNRKPNNKNLVNLICHLDYTRIDTIITVLNKLKTQSPTNKQLYTILSSLDGKAGFLKISIKETIRLRIKYINKLR